VIEVNELVGDERVRKQPLLAPLARWCDRMIFGAASLIVVVSPHLKRRIESSGFDGSKVIVLPNAVRREDFVTPADGSAVRRRLGLENAVVIGFVGWFVPWHRLDMLVGAFAEAAANHATAKLLLVGDGELRAAIETRARELGVASRVVFSGAASHADVPAHIAAMDVCVVPHSNEFRSPIKLFEYMAQGRAVVAPRTEPVEMVVRDGSNGLLFEPQARGQLAALLAKLSGDAALRGQLGGEARRDVLANHTWTQNCRRVLEKLAELGITAR
jgi:glycosyltransferase involved in cell wall biosynthesis